MEILFVAIAIVALLAFIILIGYVKAPPIPHI